MVKNYLEEFDKLLKSKNRILENSSLDDYKEGYKERIPDSSNISFVLKSIKQGKSYESLAERGEVIKTLDNAFSENISLLNKASFKPFSKKLKDAYMGEVLEKIVSIGEAYYGVEHGVRISVKQRLLKAVKSYKTNTQEELSAELDGRLRTLFLKDNPVYSENFGYDSKKLLSSLFVLSGASLFLFSSMNFNAYATYSSVSGVSNPFESFLFMGVALFVMGLVGLVISMK